MCLLRRRHPAENDKPARIVVEVAHTYLRATGRAVVLAGLHPFVNAVLVESVPASHQAQIVVRIVIIEADQALRTLFM